MYKPEKVLLNLWTHFLMALESGVAGRVITRALVWAEYVVDVLKYK